MGPWNCSILILHNCVKWSYLHWLEGRGDLSGVEGEKLVGRCGRYLEFEEDKNWH
jgi:hypothetical protein